MADRVWRISEPLAGGMAPDLDAWPAPLPQLLFNRGLRTRAEVEAFLYPERGTPNDPFALLGMEVAVERVFQALRNEETIAIYGDFDVDGLTAVALLSEVLESPALQGRVVRHLPHRSKDGYGLHADAIKGLADAGARLLITVDCGIGADEQVRYASSLGLDVVVTDHHLVSRGVPPALAVLNARQEGCPYPFKELSGVGMAFKLAEGLLSRIWSLDEARRRLRPQLDLVALGAIADAAPLIGENRLLVRLGLQEMGRTARPGLRALLRRAGWAERPVDAECVSYVLAPRLNAAGRMGDASASLELLLARSESEATRIAAELEEANRSRQAATVSSLAAARADVLRLGAIPPAIVVAGDYPAGIVGLVAARLADEFLRPAFVIEVAGEECRGSVRGVPGFDAVKALSDVSDLLIRFGGHAQAGGFALAADRLEAFRERVEADAVEQLGCAVCEAELLLEAPLSLGAVGPALHRNLTLLEPFGAGNSRPVFYSRGVRIRDARTVGNGHLKLWLADDSGSCPAIGFGMGNGSRPFAVPGAAVDCAYTVSRDERNGYVSYELVLKDLRPARSR